MAYSVVFDVPNYSKNKFTSFRGTTPFMKWISDDAEDRQSVLFTYDVHHGPDICEHTMFVPDTNGKTGYMLFVCDADYTFIDVCARVLIDVERKMLYFSSLIVDYECIFWGEEKKYVGGMKAFKKMDDHQQIVQNMVERFFGMDWRFSLGYSKYQKKSHAKKNEKRVKLFDAGSVLNNDMYGEILRMMSDWTDVSRVTSDDIKHLKQVAVDNVGAVEGWGRYYAWNSTIAVYNPV
jgi:hypothetical protein